MSGDLSETVSGHVPDWKEVGMITGNGSSPAYEPPALQVLGSVHELTQQGCDKSLGHSDGFTFQGNAIVCRST
jgi:hypothetical protein